MKSVADVVTPAREASSADAETVKMSASELLAAYKIIRFFVESTLPTMPGHEALAPMIDSFRAACYVIDLYHKVKRGDVSDNSVSAWLAAIQHHARAHAAAYGLEHFKPNHHLILHIPG